MLMYKGADELLKKIKQVIELSPGNVKFQLPSKMIVGFDYCGEETKMSFCPFNHEPFINFLNERRRLGSFGFRIHGCELLPKNNEEFHIAAFCKTISDIINKVDKSNESSFLRIGHGIELANKINLSKSKTENLSGIHKIIKEAMGLIQKHDIGIEICPSSNEYLTHVDNDPQPPIVTFIKNGFNAFFATDNEGIWPIPLPGSVLGEYMSSGKYLSDSQIKKMIEGAKKSQFSK